MRLAVDAHHVDAVHGHRDAVRLSAVKQRAAYAVDLNHRIGNNPASDVRNASCTATLATTLHPMSATRTRFQLTRTASGAVTPARHAPQRGAAEAHGIK